MRLWHPSPWDLGWMLGLCPFLGGGKRKPWPLGKRDLQLGTRGRQQEVTSSWLDHGVVRIPGRMVEGLPSLGT